VERAVTLVFGISCLAAAVTFIAVGAVVLGSAGKDLLELIVQLPTRSAKDDDEDAREAIRRRGRNEMICLLAVRSWPGWLLIVSGIALLAYTIATFPR
jgi:hypothetical protein